MNSSTINTINNTKQISNELVAITSIVTQKKLVSISGISRIGDEEKEEGLGVDRCAEWK